MTKTMGKRAAIYARFSCDKQRDASIDDQLYECTRYAEAHDYVVVGHYCDYALSGRSDDRPQFLRMIEDASTGVFDVVLLWKIDRFARNLQDQYYYERELNHAGVTIESVRENISGKGIEASLNKAMTALFAQVRSQQSAEDTMRGMLGKARRCEYLGVNLFGYDHDGDKIILDPVRAPIAAEIHARYLQGEQVEQIVDWLNDQGVKNKNGKPVGKNFVYGILANPRYAGTYLWGKQKDEEGNVMLDEAGDPIPLVCVEDGMPAIVTREMKETIRERLGVGAKRRGTPEDYVLSGKLYCSKCGQNMHGLVVYNKQGRPYRYYACKHKQRACRGSVRRDKLEALVADGVRDVLRDRRLCRKLARQYVKWQSLHETSAAKDALNAERRDVARKRERIMDAVADGMPWADAKPRVESLDLQLAALDKRAADLERRCGGYTEADIMDFFADLASHETATDDELLRVFVSRVWLFDDVAVATLSFAGKGSSRYEVELALSDETPDDGRVRPNPQWCPHPEPGQTLNDGGHEVILLQAGFGVVIPMEKAS